MNDAIKCMQGEETVDWIIALPKAVGFQEMNYVVRFDGTGKVLGPARVPSAIVGEAQRAYYDEDA